MTPDEMDWVQFMIVLALAGGAVPEAVGVGKAMTK